jgi:undecaprenyl phosphate N,N'-diacetylbacillosamine 1-phosphate transferase
VYKLFFKRVFDLLVVLLLITLTFPLFLFTIIILNFQSNESVFFFQERPGLHQKPFKIIKFKTMTDKRDVQGKLLPDIQRITRFGGLIRKLSIDELPQFFNVLKGDMSLVGPRPLLCKYIPLYSKEQLRRHEVRPGITGWAQVNGRNAISWTKKFELDVEYVNHVTFLMDVKIILLTIKKVLVREGVNQSDARPMHPFNGSN